MERILNVCCIMAVALDILGIHINTNIIPIFFPFRGVVGV